jgi:sulfoxide reductase heme-binding subunit YedZ
VSNSSATQASRAVATGVVIGALLPLALLLVRVWQHTLGADPVAIALNQLGLLALILLLASLSATPLRLWFGITWPMRLRRLLGLLAFFYATLHFLTYLLVDQGLALRAIVEDVTQRRFITVGFVAFVMLVPLAATSTKAMVQRLGAKRWRQLHRLVYLAGLLAVVHFVWRVKKDLSQPLLYASVLAVLLGVRLLHAAKRRAASEARALPRS